jgi:hypothetical protein
MYWWSSSFSSLIPVPAQLALVLTWLQAKDLAIGGPTLSCAFIMTRPESTKQNGSTAVFN